MSFKIITDSFLENIINKKLSIMVKVKVINTPVRRYFVISFFESLFSAIYLIKPLFIPPVDRTCMIVEKLLSWPTKATPAGPIKIETIFRLINPATILIKVAMAFIEKTFIKSLFKNNFNLLIKYFLIQ